MPFFQISYVHQGIDIPFFCQRRRVYAGTDRFHVYLFVNPKSELKFKMVVTVGLRDISSMYITLETSYVFILYVYYLRIKLTRFCQRRRVYAGTAYISCIFGSKPKKRVGIRNSRYSRLQDISSMYITLETSCFHFICLLFKN